MNKYLYQYTGLDTLFAIIHGYKINQSSHCIQLRASCIYNMNDPKEMYAGYDFFKKIMPQYELDNNIPVKYRLSSLLNDKEVEQKCRNKYVIRDIRDVLVEKYAPIPYVTCFSERRDYLPMWSLYGKGGTGVCLIFNIEKIVDYTCANDNKCKLGNVVYGSCPDQNFRTLFELLYNDYIDEMKDKNTILKDDKVDALDFMCEFLSPFIKYKDYKYEKEWRLIYEVCEQAFSPFMNTSQIRNKFNDLMKERDTLIPIKPFITNNLDVNCLHGVIMGPCVNYEVMKPVIKRELNEAGLELKISKSRIPYRITK